MGADALEVRISYDPVAINIAREEAKWNITMGLSVSVDVLRVQNDVLHVGHTREIRSHFVTAEGNCTDRGRPTRDGHCSGSHRNVEGEHSRVVAGDTIFNSRRAGERHVDVERTGSSLGHTRGRADQGSARARADAVADETRDLKGIGRTRGLSRVCFLDHDYQRLVSRHVYREGVGGVESGAAARIT